HNSRWSTASSRANGTTVSPPARMTHATRFSTSAAIKLTAIVTGSNSRTPRGVGCTLPRMTRENACTASATPTSAPTPLATSAGPRTAWDRAIGCDTARSAIPVARIKPPIDTWRGRSSRDVWKRGNNLDPNSHDEQGDEAQGLDLSMDLHERGRGWRERKAEGKADDQIQAKR